VKRALDVAVSAVLLSVLSPLLALLAVLVRLTSPGPALHRARRVGRGGHEFTMYKLRTMRRDAASTGPGITGRGDARITSLGRALRRTRLDELPQLWNVLRGDMSLVGPRPEDPRFVARYTPEQRTVLSVRPGITGPAQLAYRDEERLLPAEATEDAYARDVLPAKLAIDLAYVRRPSLLRDLAVLARTLAGVVRR
jgi:lipopolysaccharide/colanic/teichoic acid biosynthesis glycosyltransferase